MNFYLFEESKLNGLGISLLLFVVVCRIIYLFVLPSQGGEYARARWAEKQKNKKAARERAYKAAAAQQRREDDNEYHRQKVRQQKPLESQASAQDFINLSVDASDWFLNNFGHLWLSMRDLMSSFHITLPELNVPDMDFNIMKYYTLLKESDVGKDLSEIIDMIVALGWMKKIELSIRGIPLFSSNRIQHRVTFPQLMEKVVTFGQLLYVRIIAVITSGSVESFFVTEDKNAYDVEFTFLKSQKVLLDLGRGNEIDDVTYDRRVAECIEKTNSYLSSCSRVERAYYSSRLAILKDIQSARTLDKKDSIREKPYGMLLFGGSGVGKSAIASSIIRYVLKVNGKDYSPKSIITLNQEDKFQSEFRTHHTGVIMDDVCNTALDRTEGSPATPIIMFLNQVPMSALNPNAEMKGMVMIEPDVVCATTNVKDLMSNQLSNEPLSINRRFEVTITQKVRPEYRKDGSEMLDNSKIRHMARDQFPDYALFTVEEPRYRENKTGDKFKSGRTQTVVFQPMYYKGKALVDVDIYTLLEFLKENSADHYAKQKEFVEAQRGMSDIDLCECGRPVGHCEKCALESQAGLPNYAEVVEYLSSLEEKACDWFTELKRTLIMSKYGHYITAFLLRDVLKGIIMNSVTHYLLAVAMIMVFEITHAAPCAILLIGITLLYVAYLLVRFYLVRRRTVESFTQTTRPSEYFRNMEWATKKKWLGVLVSLGVWRLLVILARKWKTLATAQAAAPITLTPDAKPYQRTVEFWDSHERERQYQFGDGGVTNTARTTTHEQIVNVVGKRQKIVLKQNGVQCNALPVKGNVLLIPNHFVSKSTEFVTVINVGGTTYKNLPLSQKVCQRIPGTDLAVWYCPGIGNQKDLTNYYPLDILEDKKMTVYTLYNDNGELKRFPEMTAKRERVVTTEGGFFPGLKYSFPEATFGGLCMATLIGTANGIPFIAGHHLAGRNLTGAAGFITRVQLSDAIEQLDSKPGVLVSHSAMPMDTVSMGVDFGPLTKPHEKCPTNDLEATSKIRIFGSHNQPRASHSKSAVVTSLISTAVTEVMGIEKQHDKPKEMGAARHKEVDLVGKVDTATKFDCELAQKAYIDYCANTINGQPVPSSGTTVVINGDVVGVKPSSSRDNSIDKSMSNSSDSADIVPQTDLDTFETKVIKEPKRKSKDLSNVTPVDDDQRSDTESVATVDSLGDGEKKAVDGPVEKRVKSHIRGRSESKSQYRTMTKTRKFMKDGELITSTTQKVVHAGDEHKMREEYHNRKNDLRELKMLQKQENKQHQDLIYKSHCAREEQERKFELDMQTLVKNYDQDMETLNKTQKQQVEKAEQNQTVDMKNAAKRLKMDQEKEYKLFKDQQKQELKLLRQELDLMPKDNKKDAIKKRKDQKEVELQEKERQFLETQAERQEKHMKQLAEVHRQKVALLESQFLQQKQQLLRGREAAIWEKEKQQLHEKHQLAKSQLKDLFFLKRHQMLTRHQKEVEQMKRSNSAKEDEMQRRHALEKKRLPKIQKSEAKTRAQMFKQSLRLSTVGSPEDDRVKMKQFEENEKKRMKAEQQRQEMKHKKQWEELVFRNESSLRELEQLQAEKRKMLMEQETQKMKELDEQYSSELREWKQQLVPRKQKLEEEFQRQKDEQEKFYGTVIITGSEGMPAPRPDSGSFRNKESVKSRHSTVI